MSHGDTAIPKVDGSINSATSGEHEDSKKSQNESVIVELPPTLPDLCDLVVGEHVKLSVDGFDFMRCPKTGAMDVVRRYTWANKNRMTVQVIDYGATITVLKVPNRKGCVHDIVMGFDDMEGYQGKNNPYFGATVGRVANRIGKSEFKLNGKVIELSPNLDKHHLHGGHRGFDKVLWDSHVEGAKVIFSHVSPDGTEGYPGTLLTQVSYELTPESHLIVEMTATCDQPTPVNLTNHSYFNLAGHGSGSLELYNHLMTINSEKYTLVDDDSIPTGKFRCVGGTMYDFRVPRSLGATLRRVPKGGYDHNMVITKGIDQDMTFVARMLHPHSGRVMEIYSDQPGVQFYTANYLPDPEANIMPKNRYDERLMTKDIIMESIEQQTSIADEDEFICDESLREGSLNSLQVKVDEPLDGVQIISMDGEKTSQGSKISGGSKTSEGSQKRRKTTQRYDRDNPEVFWSNEEEEEEGEEGEDELYEDEDFEEEEEIEEVLPTSGYGPAREPIIGKSGAQYLRHGALCLETQKFPDAVHHKNFPSIILNPGQTYRHRVTYKFGLQFTIDESFREMDGDSTSIGSESEKSEETLKSCSADGESRASPTLSRGSNDSKSKDSKENGSQGSDVSHSSTGSKRSKEKYISDFERDCAEKQKSKSVYADKDKSKSVYGTSADKDKSKSVYGTSADRDKSKSVYADKEKSKSVYADKEKSKSVYADKEKSKSVYGKSEDRDKSKSVYADKDKSKSVYGTSEDRDKSKSVYADKEKSKSVYADKEKSKSVYADKEKSKSVYADKEKSKSVYGTSEERDKSKSVYADKEKSKSVYADKEKSKSVYADKEKSKSVYGSSPADKDKSKSVYGTSDKEKSKSVYQPTDKNKSKSVYGASK